MPKSAKVLGQTLGVGARFGRMISVLSVTSEVFPLIKTGGLADVAGALPAALAPEGVAVTTLVPGYPAVMAALENATEVMAFPDLFREPARLLAGRAGGLDVLVLEAAHLYDRAGNPYSTPDGADWPDNAQRFAALCQAAAAIAADPALAPDVVHAHDWQAGLAPAYIALGHGKRPATVITIHNLAFQGWAPADLLDQLGLPASSFSVDGVEYFGGIGFLKAGLFYADAITTVSPTYAAEIMSDGMALEGLLRTRADDVRGILNGIDTAVWDPARDAALVAPFGAKTLARRAASRAALRAELGLAARPDALLFGVVSRLSEQKGLDLLLQALPTLLAEGAQLAILGSGDLALEEGFAAAIADHPGQVAGVFRYDEDIAHRMQAGCDALLVPSRYEPCGLTQLIAMRYGALPVVARVGGLADTVIDANAAALAQGAGTGFVFSPVNVEMLQWAIRRCAAVWRDRKNWRRLQDQAMAADFSWQAPAKEYARLYRDLLLPRK